LLLINFSNNDQGKSVKMGLSKKHLSYNPWNDVTVKMGEEVSGQVVELQSRGALVKIQGVNAFLPIGEISNERVEKVSDALKFEEVIKVLVLRGFYEFTH